MADSSDDRNTAAVLTRPDAQTRERAQPGKPPELEPVGQCPYCHHDLERRDVKQELDVRLTPLGSPLQVRVILAFWACMNRHCALMFWRCPVPVNPHGVDEDFLH